MRETRTPDDLIVGAVLTLPGASYLAGLHQIKKLNYATASTVLLVVGATVRPVIAVADKVVELVLAGPVTERAVGVLWRGPLVDAIARDIAEYACPRADACADAGCHGARRRPRAAG